MASAVAVTAGASIRQDRFQSRARRSKVFVSLDLRASGLAGPAAWPPAWVATPRLSSPRPPPSNMGNDRRQVPDGHLAEFDLVAPLRGSRAQGWPSAPKIRVVQESSGLPLTYTSPLPKGGEGRGGERKEKSGGGEKIQAKPSVCSRRLHFGHCCVMQWMPPPAAAKVEMSTCTTSRSGKAAATVSRATASSFGNPKLGITTPPLAI